MKALKMLLKTGNGLSTNCYSNLSGLGRTHGRRSTVDVFRRVSYKQSAPYSTEYGVAAVRVQGPVQGAPTATAAAAFSTAATAAATAEAGASKKILLIDGHNLASRVRSGLSKPTHSSPNVSLCSLSYLLASLHRTCILFRACLGHSQQPAAE
jgi:hypothetical protein